MIGARAPVAGSSLPADTADLWPLSANVGGSDGALTLGSCRLADLAEAYGTPLYVFDEAEIRAAARQAVQALALTYPGSSTVCYAAKAYCAPWLLRLLAAEGLGLDIVSGGERYVADAAHFPTARIYFHGNNKGEDELDYAIGLGTGRIVLDNLDEIERVGRLAARRGIRQRVLLRVGPGVEAHTHAHLRTGAIDTKFGLDIRSGQAEAGVHAALAQPALEVRGLHAHIGSQIDDVEPYRLAVERLFQFATDMRAAVGLDLREISPGGGFAVRYSADDPAVSAPTMIQRLAEIVHVYAVEHGFSSPLPHLTIEPGRSLIARAAVALYRVGSVKAVPNGRTYVAVDGGMADNVRAAAYGAQYTAALADRMHHANDCEVAIVGKYCESGDILVSRVRIPAPRVGDLVAIPMSGAYHLSMASNYNLAPRPAVVVVTGGTARLVRRRETYADLLAPEVRDPKSATANGGP